MRYIKRKKKCHTPVIRCSLRASRQPLFQSVLLSELNYLLHYYGFGIVLSLPCPALVLHSPPLFPPPATPNTEKSVSVQQIIGGWFLTVRRTLPLTLWVLTAGRASPYSPQASSAPPELLALPKDWI